jgi:hypothetical protein
MDMSRCNLEKNFLKIFQYNKKLLTPIALRCVIISFTSRSSGKITGEAVDRCCWVDLAIFPKLTRTCTRRRADNGSFAKQRKKFISKWE